MNYKRKVVGISEFMERERILLIRVCVCTNIPFKYTGCWFLNVF